MAILETLINKAERAPLPDSLTSLGIQFLVGRTRRKLATLPASAEKQFAEAMRDHAIAEHVDAANAQHYELPPHFFTLTLGPRRKYSCGFYESEDATLADAEICALAKTVANAQLRNGQHILELGCGWGSLSLYMAEQFPDARITAVSNSGPQRAFIEAEAQARGLSNLHVITADMNNFTPEGLYDRVISVEMFEHMSNWRSLLARINAWLKPEGRLFVHIFTHRNQPYRFDEGDKADWIAQHFFTGGIMPSHGLMRHFPDSFTVERSWRWNGEHYARTARDWLANFDANHVEIDRILTEVYGADAALWRRRWRLFYLATAGLFGHAEGTVWGVSHYLLRPVRA